MYRPPTERHLVLRLLLSLAVSSLAAGCATSTPPSCRFARHRSARRFRRHSSSDLARAGSDAELLESGVTPADILAFAQDYGAWSLRNLAQLNALLEQGE